MEKIIKIAIEAKFPGLDVTNLLEVILQTGNAVVATETLLGIYQTPELPETVTISNNLHEFISFDKYKEEVFCEKSVMRYKTLYFETEESAAECVDYNLDLGRDYYSKGDWKVSKEFKVLVKEKDRVHVNYWKDSNKK